MIRLKSPYVNTIRLVLILVFGILTSGGCRIQSNEQNPDARPGNTPYGIEFLQKPSGQELRVMSFNVNWDSIFPDNDPQNDPFRRYSTGPAFGRILQAIEPDVLCMQEINPNREAQQVADILDGLLPLESGRKWQAHSGRDNVIAARFDLRMQDEERVISGGITNPGHAMALVDLPGAEYEEDLYLICAHFKSSGGQADIRARQEHADAIIAWIADARAPGGEVDLPDNTPIIVLGDFNVYDTDPAHHLTTLLSGDIVNEVKYGADIKPDWDESDLADALPRHNAAAEETYTWRDDTQEFNPGALDRILYTDSMLGLENAFVLNTEIVTEEELRAAGLQAGDVMLDPATGEYDHLPLAVDFSFHDMLPEQ